MKRIVLFWIPLLLLLLVNCTTESFDFGDQEGILVEGSGGGGSSQPNPTIPEGSEDLLGFTIAFDESDRTTYGSMSETVTSDDDFIENSQFASVVTITYNGTTATVGNGVSGVEVSSNGAHIVVNSTVSGVEYVLNGTTTNGSFKVYSEKKFKLSLAGVSILNPVGAAINIQSSKRVFVVCADETTNVLTDGSSYTATTDGEDMKACLFSEGQLIFSGGGSLTVTGNYKHAITSDDYVRFRSGCNITVVSAKKDGIHTNESVIIGGGILNISSDGDAIQCEEGGITMTGGFAKLSTTDNKAHGLKSCLDVVISGGAIQAQVAGAASKGISCDGNLTISGGKLTAFTSQTALYEDNDLSSCAGIKCDGNILITGGDAFMSQNKTLRNILKAVYKMAVRKRNANLHRAEGEKYAELQRVRLGSRLPVYLPMRINDELLEILREFKEKASAVGVSQFLIQTHFQTPLEVTPEAREAIRKILAAGWTITNQLVYNVAASRRGHTAKLRKVLNGLGVLCYYTFSVKGFEENYAVFAPNSRSLQEKEEEKVWGKLSAEQEKEFLNLLRNSKDRAAAVQRFCTFHQIPFVATDRSVLNLPGIGKSMTFVTIGMTKEGKRILEFDHDPTRQHSPIIHQMKKIYIKENKSIWQYMLQLQEMGEKKEEYASLWKYMEGETEHRFPLYNYPDPGFRITEKYSHLSVVGNKSIC